MNTENGNTGDCILKAVPRQTAGRTGELVFNVLWSYVEDMIDHIDYITVAFAE